MSQPGGNFTRFTTEPASATSSLWHARWLENQVVWTLWLTYGAFYFCRTNISAAVPGMQSSIGEGGAGLSSGEVGWILASLKVAYGVGQFINGQLSERISPRVMLALGMFGSAALNVAFGSGAGFYFLLFVWATNGFCQSLGWTPCVRVAANWVPVERRGNALGIIGTGYQITLGITYLVASLSADWLGWRGAFYVPSVLLALAGLFMLVALREAPPVEMPKSSTDATTAPLPASKTSFSDTLYWTLFNPVLWLLGLSLGLLNACRYGFVDWGIAHLMESRDVAVGKAGLQFFVIAIGATAGSYLAGWATDRWFGGRRGPVACVLMTMLGSLTLVYNGAVQSSVIGSLLLLVAIGFCIYGPQVLLVGTAPADLAHRGTSAAAAGFVNFMGYMGAAMGDVVTGYFSEPEHGGWQVTIYIWAGWAFAGAAIMAILWNTTTDKIGVVPRAVPRLAALAMLLIAAGANVYGEQSFALTSATVAAVICLAGTFASRWAAAPLIGIAAAGLLVVFSSYVRSGDVTLHMSLAMAGYALTMICALMILVDRGAERCELL